MLYYLASISERRERERKRYWERREWKYTTHIHMKTTQ
jgi:hypothetical protein